MSTISTIEDIVRITNKRAQPLEAVLLKAKINTKQLQGAVEEGAKRGFQIRVRDGYVFSQVAAEGAERIVIGAVKPGRYSVCHFSDTHFGCRHTAEEDILEHLTRSWEAGARVAVHTGDLLDGNKPVLLGDQDWVGFESQFIRCLRTIRKAPPFTYVAIDGNHDGYYSASIGTPSGAIVASRMRENGIDWRFAGVCVGRAQIHGADWHLWHPAGGSASKMGVIKVMSDRVDDLGEHVDVLAMGHLHKFVAATWDGALLVAPGTYQRKKSEFANRISGDWDIGGALVSYDVDKGGYVHALAADQRKARP